MNPANNLRYALDRSELFRDVVKAEPDEWQARLLASENKRIALCIARQLGKSQTTAILCAHEVLFNPGSLVIAVAPSLRQSTEICRAIFDAVKKVEPDVKM